MTKVEERRKIVLSEQGKDASKSHLQKIKSRITHAGHRMSQISLWPFWKGCLVVWHFTDTWPQLLGWGTQGSGTWQVKSITARKLNHHNADDTITITSAERRDQQLLKEYKRPILIYILQTEREKERDQTRQNKCYNGSERYPFTQCIVIVHDKGTSMTSFVAIQ